MAFRGMYDIPGHGQVNVYDYESEVPRSLLGRKVGIVEATASNDLRYGKNSVIMSPNPGPLGIFGLIAIVAIMIGAIFICWMLTATTVTKTDNGYYIQVPGAVYWVDEYGNIISQQGTPTLPAIGDIVKPIVIGALILGGLYVTVRYILPAFTQRRDRYAYTAPPTALAATA